MNTENQTFVDGVLSMTNTLVNQRNAINNNEISHKQMDDVELSACFKHGLFTRIRNIKIGYALKDAFVFDCESDRKFYEKEIAKVLKQACHFQLGFGRGVIVIIEKDCDPGTPMVSGVKKNKCQFRVFDKTKVSPLNPSLNLLDERYNKPLFYSINGVNFHWTRVIDMTYVMPIDDELPDYDYAGISESELIREQLVSDGIISRGNASIIDKMSTLFYKFDNFNELMQTKQEGEVIRHAQLLENLRGIFGSGVTDKSTDIQVVSQSLTGLDKMNEVSFRRIVMVTGLPMQVIASGAAQGLSNMGPEERQVLNDTTDAYRDDYILPHLSTLFERLGMEQPKAKESSNLTPSEQVAYEKNVLENAQILMSMGEDHDSYLIEKGVVPKDTFDMFNIEDV